MALQLSAGDMASGSQDVNSKHPIMWASKEDWAKYKAVISGLYEQYTLPEVMAAMETQYGFKATWANQAHLMHMVLANPYRRAKMYKTRIKEWGLDKKHKENEMRVIVHKHAHRVGKGKASTFRIRGKVVEYKDVVRYWERRHIPISDVIASRAASSTPEPLECLTPVPSPVRTPDILALPERLYIVLRDYHKAFFEAGTLGLDRWGPRFNSATLDHAGDSIGRKCGQACTLFDNHHFVEGRVLLDDAIELMGKIVQAEPPHTLSRLFLLLLFIRWKGRREVAAMILRHTSALGEIYLGKNHPLKLICGWLESYQQTNPNGCGEIIYRSLEIMYESFERSLGRSHYIAMEAYLKILMEAISQGSNARERALLRFLRVLEAHLAQGDIRTTALRSRITREHRHQGSFPSALVEAIKFQLKVSRISSSSFSIDGKDLSNMLYILRIIERRCKFAAPDLIPVLSQRFRLQQASTASMPLLIQPH